MGAKRVFKKVALDMSLVQSVWVGWFIGIVFIIYITINLLSGNVEVNGQNLDSLSFLTFTSSAAKIFMLVIGIISVSGFLTFYVQQGVTRRDYFYGSAISSVAIAVGLMAGAWIVTFIEGFINPEIVNPTFLGSETSWFFIAIVFCLYIIMYYMAGWVIGAGFYRFGAGGLLYILLALIMVGFVETLWELKDRNFLLHFLEFGNGEIPLSVSFLGTFVIIALAMVIVRVTTRKVRIKMK